jgi:hypothetical protein
MKEDGSPLRFGLLNNVYMSCDSSFVKFVTGLMLIVALGCPNRCIFHPYAVLFSENI